MAFKIELVSLDQHDHKATLVSLDAAQSGNFKTWWGETVSLKIEDNAMLELDLRACRSIREGITGNKRGKKFLRRLDPHGFQQLSQRLMLVWGEQDRYN